MEELKLLITRAQAGDLDAYGTIVRRFQDMAVGYAYSILGDFHLAEDAAQEAFIEAYPNLSKVYGPAAFPSWLRRIIFKHCDRFRRGMRFEVVPLEEAIETPSAEKDPAEAALEREMKDNVLYHLDFQMRLFCICEAAKLRSCESFAHSAVDFGFRISDFGLKDHSSHSLFSFCNLHSAILLIRPFAHSPIRPFRFDSRQIVAFESTNGISGNPRVARTGARGDITVLHQWLFTPGNRRLP